MHVFCKCAPLRRPLVFSRASCCGARRTRPYTATHVWAPAEIRGTCFGRLKSHELAIFCGIAFRPARAKQVHRNTELSLFHFSVVVA